MKLKDIRELCITCITVILLSLVQCGAYAARNVILMIGDGMGFQHVNAAGYYLNGASGTLCFEPYYKCSVVTSCLDSTAHPITDSAAAASAIATGNKVNYLTISQSPTGTPYQTILEIAKTMGKRTGLVTTDPITRATPAGFAAHDPDRNNLIAIGNDYLNSSRPDVMMGGGGTMAGGSSFFSTAQITAAQSLGYQTAYNRNQMNAVSSSANRVLGLFTTNEMTYEYDRPANTNEPHLSEMASKALSLMDTDTDGFFLMIEGAKVDYGAHANDITRTTMEVVEFNNTVQTVLNWMQGRSDTLLIVTADHETGGLTATNNGKGSFAGATWSSLDHTAANVPLYAYGADTGLVTAFIQNGSIDNTNIFKIMRKAFAPELATPPFMIYQQFGQGTGGSGNLYYGGGVFDDAFYTGQIGQGAQQWRDEQIAGTALMNTTLVGYAPPAPAPANIAKASLPLGGYIYMSNGGGTLYRSANWSSDPVQVDTPVIAEAICTDGTYIYMTSGTSSDYHKVHKWAVNHSTGTVTEAAGWPVSIGTSTSVRFRGISCYNGKLYLANFKKTGELYEVDATTRAVSNIATVSTAADNHYQCVRYGNRIFLVGLDGVLRTFSLSGSTWTLSASDDLGIAAKECYGIGVKGEGITPRYAWVTNKPGQVSFFDLYPGSVAAGGIGEARHAKNGYPVAVSAQDASVTAIGAEGFWAEDKDRSAGIFVQWTGEKPAVNTEVGLTGGVITSASGEKQFVVKTMSTGNQYAIDPVFLTQKSAGPAGGVSGLANDGMLVTICGSGKYYDPYYNLSIYVEDGSGVANDVPGTAAGMKICKVDGSPLWDVPNIERIAYGLPCMVTVTGVVRLEKLTDGTIIRRIDARSGSDIVITNL